MKLLRWAVAGASVYAVYRYSIGKKAKGEDVLVSQDKAIADLTKAEGGADEDSAAKPDSSPAAKKPRTRKQGSQIG